MDDARMEELIEMLRAHVMRTPYETAYDEATRYNVFTEYNAIMGHINAGRKLNNYDYARATLLRYVITAVEKDPESGDHTDKQQVDQVRKAGRLLNKTGGIEAMRDPLLWSFIPRRYHREIEHYWNNIGEWRA